MRTARAFRQSPLGAFDATALIALGFRTIEVRTALTPPMVIDLLAPADPRTAETMSRIKPAVVLSGNLGRVEIAPYGMPSGIDPQLKSAAVSIGLGLGAAVLGVMVFGRLFLR